MTLIHLLETYHILFLFKNSFGGTGRGRTFVQIRQLKLFPDFSVGDFTNDTSILGSASKKQIRLKGTIRRSHSLHSSL